MGPLRELKAFFASLPPQTKLERVVRLFVILAIVAMLAGLWLPATTPEGHGRRHVDSVAPEQAEADP